MDEAIELTVEEKKIKNLRIAAATFTAIAGVCNLVKTPITTGVAIAAGLGSVLCTYAASCYSADNFGEPNTVAFAR